MKEAITSPATSKRGSECVPSSRPNDSGTRSEQPDGSTIIPRTTGPTPGGHRHGRQRTRKCRCGTFPGDSSNQVLIRTIEDDLAEWILDRVVWVAGRGFNSVANRAYLQ